MSVKRIVLLSATLASFLSPFMASAVNIALKRMGDDLGMTAVTLGWVTGVYLVSAAILLIPFGLLGDACGRKRIFLWGMAVLTASSFLAGLAWSPPWLILARIGQGIGNAMIFSTGLAMVTSVFGPGERGRALGINVAAVYVGLSIGPYLGGLLTDWFGWRSVFLVNVPLGLMVIAFLVLKLKEEWRSEGDSALGLFGPIWRNRAFVFSNLAALINYSATFSVTFLLSLYLQYIKGMSPHTAGLVLVAQPIIMAIFSPMAGRWSDRIESRIIASIGMGFTALGLVLFAFLGMSTGVGYIIAALVIIGFGFALFSSPNTNAIMSAVDKAYYGVASAMVSTMRLIGQIFSMGLVMLLFYLLIGTKQITPPLYPPFVRSAQITFTISAALCLLGILASLARGKTK